MERNGDREKARKRQGLEGMDGMRRRGFLRVV